MLGHAAARRAWLAYVLASLVPLALYPTLPAGAQAVVFDGLAVLAGLAVLVGVRIHRPARRLPWVLLAVAQLAWAAGDITWDLISLGMGLDPFPSAADILYLAGYVIASIGLMRFHAGWRETLDWRSLADGVIVALAIGSLAWIALVDPVLAEPPADPIALAVSIAYPIGDLVLIALLVALVTGAKRPPAAAWLLAASLGVSIVADALFAMTSVEDPAQNVVDVLTLLAYTLWGAAALHRSMVDVPGERSKGPSRLTMLRVACVGVAMSIPVAVLALDQATGHGIDSMAVVVAYPMIAVAAALRLWDLMRSSAHQEEIHRTVLDRSPDAIFLAGGDPPVVKDANEAAAVMLRRPREEIVGTLISDLVAPGELQRQRERVEAMRRTGAHVVAEFPMLRPDGTVADVEMSEQATSDGEIVALARDVGVRRHAEAERARLAAALEQSTDMVMIADLEGRVLFVNPAFERATGVTFEALRGREPVALADVLDVPPDDARIAASLQAGRPWAGQMSIRRPGAPDIAVDVAVSQVRGPDGAPIGVVGIGRDVTQQRAIEAQLRQAQKMEAVGLLAGGMAHDFNNLLTAIRGYSEMIREGIEAGRQPSRDDVDEVLRAADRAAVLTSQMLAFARRQHLRPRPVEPGAVIEGIGSLLRTVVGEQVKVVLGGTPGSGTVMVDPAALEQVVVNLALNARDAMPDGGTLSFEVSEVGVAAADARRADVPPGDYVRLRVGDTGMGMTAEVRAHAFEPFFTTKEPGRGTGMGLATVYGIVRQSGGYVSIDSRPGGGTRVDVMLPHVTDASPSEDAPPVPTVQNAGHETILVVEDEPAVRRFARRALEARGYTVLEASDGVTAERLVGTWGADVDLIVTDVVMPGMGGRELGGRLRARDASVRVLFVSGFTERGPTSVEGATFDGSFLAKPFTADALATAVRAVLDAPARSPAQGSQ